MSESYWPEDAIVAVDWQPDDEGGTTGVIDMQVRFPVPQDFVTFITPVGKGERT